MEINGTEAIVQDWGADLNITWYLLAGCGVFLMQAGFAMLEAGSVAKKNTVNILFKNLLDVSLAAFCFWAVGYGFATGTSAGGVIGSDNFFLSEVDNESGGWEGFFFQFAFAATAATIVSGSVAERTKLNAYFIYSFCITGFVYPVVAHWGWNGGFLSAWGDKVYIGNNGLIDFAGSGVVHMVGGFAGLVGAYVVGPRSGRFEVNPDGSFGEARPMPGHSMVLNSLGVVLLWFGWFFFNGGSTLCAFGCMEVAAKTIVNTTLAAASATITATFTGRVLEGHFDLNVGLNAVIAGLVSITAGCSVVQPIGAILIGMIGAPVYIFSDKLLLKFHIDDPLQASALHGFCGAWGLLAVGIFATDELVEFAGYPNVPNEDIASKKQFGVQLLAVLVITAWTILVSALIFIGIDKTIGMRVDKETERIGLDNSEHGGAKAYVIKSVSVSKATNISPLDNFVTNPQ